MKRIFTRSRSLLLAVILAVVAATCTVAPARAASSAVKAPAAASSSQCNFTASLTSCKSTNPTVSYISNAYGDTSNCTFVFGISWGDGHSTGNIVQTNPSDGPHLLAKHTYFAAKAYTITVTAQLTAGKCTATGSTHIFTLAKLTHDGQDWAKCGKGSCTLALDHQWTQALSDLLASTPKGQLLGVLFAFCNTYAPPSVWIRGACSVLATAIAVDATPISRQLIANDNGHGVYITLSVDYHKIGITPQK